MWMARNDGVMSSRPTWRDLRLRMTMRMRSSRLRYASLRMTVRMARNDDMDRSLDDARDDSGAVNSPSTTLGMTICMARHDDNKDEILTTSLRFAQDDDLYGSE